MPSMLVSGMSVGVGAGASIDIQPPASQEWLIHDLGNSLAFVANVADISISLRDGVHNDTILVNDPVIDASRRYRMYLFYITNGCYLRVTNTGGAGANISWFGERVRSGLTVSQINTIGAGASIFIQPPPGQTWEIYYFAADVWTGAGDRNPDVSIGITDGTLIASNTILPTQNVGQDKILRWIIDDTTYLRVTDTSAGGLDFGFSGRRVQHTCVGGIQDVAGGGTLDIQPPAGQEWVITELSSEQWAGGGAPNNKPDITVSLRVGANLSTFLEAGSISNCAVWGREWKLALDNTNFLRIANVNVGNNEVGWLGYLKRTYS